MKRLTKTIVLAGVAGTLLFGTTHLTAQEQRQRGGGQGGFDPAQMQERMMEMYQERLGMSAEEFKAIKPLLDNVMTKQREAMSGRGFGAFGRGGGGPGGRPGGDQGGGRGRGGFGGAPSPEQEALQSAVESGTPAEIKAKLEAYRDARKKREAALEEAQEKLRNVLSQKQEAQLVLIGMLK